MEGRLHKLSQRRVVMLLVSLAYFLALLAAGGLIFLADGPYGYVVVLGLVLVYLLAVRPMGRRYKQLVRAELFSATLGEGLKDYRYQPRAGVDRAQLEQSRLVPVPLKALHSRERIRGSVKGMGVELADVTFPIRVGNRNEMFSGCYIAVRCPGASFPHWQVRAGCVEAASLSVRQLELVKKLGEKIPGSVYMNMEEERLDILLRGRFLGVRINPLMTITPQALANCPVPELELAIRLAEVSAKEGRRGTG